MGYSCHKYMSKKTVIGMLKFSFVAQGFKQSIRGKSGGEVTSIQYVNITSIKVNSVRCKVEP